MGQDAMQHLVTLDLLVPIALTRALLPAMVTRGVGHVALVGSVAGRTGVAGEAVYAATKAGLDVFAESLRLELTGSGVGVTLVVPGAVDTPFFTARGRPYDRRFPRPVHPDRVAAATVEAIRRDRPVVTVPRWLTLASVVRAAAPGAFRRLSARFGEPVRSGRRG
jgi:short-subunit dehydrogenase